MNGMFMKLNSHSSLCIICIGFALVLQLGCGKPKGEASAVAPIPEQPAASVQPGTAAGAKALLAEFTKPGADHAALSQKFRPTSADFLAVFHISVAKQAETAYTPAWDSNQLVLKPKANQTEIIVNSATTDDFRKWNDAAKKHFPGGYERVARDLQPGITIYSAQFVEPGKTFGTAVDGLIYVNGNWRIFPKPWNALR